MCAVPSLVIIDFTMSRKFADLWHVLDENEEDRQDQ